MTSASKPSPAMTRKVSSRGGWSSPETSTWTRPTSIARSDPGEGHGERGVQVGERHRPGCGRAGCRCRRAAARAGRPCRPARWRRRAPCRPRRTRARRARPRAGPPWPARRPDPRCVVSSHTGRAQPSSTLRSSSQLDLALGVRDLGRVGHDDGPRRLGAARGRGAGARCCVPGRARAAHRGRRWLQREQQGRHLAASAAVGMAAR